MEKKSTIERIQLKHPLGKNNVNMDKAKYTAIRAAILKCLKLKTELTHTEMLRAITADFKKNKFTFDGSVEWYMEGVKLDMEAKKTIKRIENGLAVTYRIA